MMYRHPKLDEVYARYWSLIRSSLQAAGIPSPEKLSQDAEEFYVWNHPELVISQTCSMPYRTWLHDKVELVGTPDFDVQGCPRGYYRSVIIVRANDPRTKVEAFKDAIFAYNQIYSQSGYAAPYWHLKPYGFWFTKRLCTQQHIKSAQAIVDGSADIASLDAISWRLIEKFASFRNELRAIDLTEPTPGLPLISAKGADAGTIFNAVASAINKLRPSDRKLLGLTGIVRIPKADYLALSNPPVGN